MVRETVLCIPNTSTLALLACPGFQNKSLNELLRTIYSSGEYRQRDLVESDPSWLQIIPYGIVKCPTIDSYFITKRLSKGTEERLHNLYSLGIGGHINPGDGQNGNPLQNGLAREWLEEVICPLTVQASFVGTLNDSSNSVGSVHLGLVFLIEIDEPVLSVRETEKLEGQFYKKEQIPSLYNSMENWSRLLCTPLLEEKLNPEKTPFKISLSASSGSLLLQ